jgi:anti-sigma B factor antagonist
MSISERRLGDITVLDIRGHIMFEDGDEELRGAIARTLQSGGLKVILNMAEVPYVDSAGLSELVRGYVAIRKAGGRVVLLDVGRKVHELLTIANLLRIFKVVESEEEARNLLDEPAEPGQP